MDTIIIKCHLKSTRHLFQITVEWHGSDHHNTTLIKSEIINLSHWHLTVFYTLKKNLGKYLQWTQGRHEHSCRDKQVIQGSSLLQVIQVTKAQLGPNHQNIWKTDIILPWPKKITWQLHYKWVASSANLTIDVSITMSALLLSGGKYCFPRHPAFSNLNIMILNIF